MRLLLTAPILVVGLMTGCATPSQHLPSPAPPQTIHTTQGNSAVMDDALIANIKEGVSSKADIRALLGEPSKVEFAGATGNLEVWKYMYAEREVHMTIPATAVVHGRVITILFDAHGVAKHVAVTNPTATSR